VKIELGKVLGIKPNEFLAVCAKDGDFDLRAKDVESLHGLCAHIHVTIAEKNPPVGTILVSLSDWRVIGMKMGWRL
jgi:hypothetical protein